MRVLLTSTDNPYTTRLGGKHIHLLLLERGLKAAGLEVTTLYRSQGPVQSIRKGLLACLSEKTRHEYKLKWMINDIRKRIPRQEFDLIHCHDVLSMIAVHSMIHKKILTLHGYFARENVEFIEREKDKANVFPLLQRYEKEGMKDADHVITVDQRLKEYIIEDFDWPEYKVTVIHNAIDTEAFRPATENRQRELKAGMRLKEDHHIILVPRRLVEKNGVIYAVQALRTLKRGDIELVIAGDGPEKERIVAEADADARIHFVGAIPHEKMLPYFQMADVVVIPSITSHGIQEATSLAMLEGMACGKTVICSNVGGMKEIVRDMENGVHVEEKDPAAIAASIERIIGDDELKTRIGRTARQHVMDNHSFVVHAAKVAQTYHEVLRG